MTLKDALSLLQPAPINHHTPTTWADLGCGSGLFTLALAQLLHDRSTIYAIDTKPQLQLQTTPSGTTLLPLKKDFEKEDLLLKNLDGILMANSLHYIKDKPALIRQLQKKLRPGAPSSSSNTIPISPSLPGCPTRSVSLLCSISSRPQATRK